MIKYMILISTLALGGAANATGNKPVPVPLTQDQTQYQEQAQSQTQANEQNTTFTGQKQVYSAIAPSLFSNNPCYVSGSAALGLKNLNIGGGRPIRDPNCEKIMASQAFLAAGERELSVAMICATEAAAEVLGDVCGPSNASEESRKKIADLERANKQLLAVRETDQEELESIRQRLNQANAEKAKCSADVDKLETNCTK